MEDFIEKRYLRHSRSNDS